MCSQLMKIFDMVAALRALTPPGVSPTSLSIKGKGTKKAASRRLSLYTHSFENIILFFQQ